jgi:hypothetical protein
MKEGKNKFQHCVLKLSITWYASLIFMLGLLLSGFPNQITTTVSKTTVCKSRGFGITNVLKSENFFY